MKAFIPLVMTLISGEFERIVRNAKRRAVLWAVVGFFALVTVSFLLVAAQMAMSILFPPLFAALIIAGCAFVICLFFLLVLQITTARSRRRARQRREDVPALAAAAVPSLFKTKKTAMFIGIPVAALAGFLLSARGRSSRRKD